MAFHFSIFFSSPTTPKILGPPLSELKAKLPGGRETRESVRSTENYGDLSQLPFQFRREEEARSKTPPSALGTYSFPASTDDYPRAFVIAENVHDNIESDDGAGDIRQQWTERLSWEPRAFIIQNFLSKVECEYLINLAMPHMEKSTSVDTETGQVKDSRVRTSSVTFLQRGRDAIVIDIEKRIADLTFIPIENGEGLQILHYEVGQKYLPHYDFFLDQFNTRNGGQRIATIIMYLSDVEDGGETVFPKSKGILTSVRRWNESSECGVKGLSIKPKMGDALLFWNTKPDNTLDPSSLHRGCPVTRGNKWSSTKWLRASEYKI